MGRRVRGPFAPSGKQLQSRRRSPTRKYSFDVTYISPRCLRKDGRDTYESEKNFVLNVLVKAVHNFQKEKIKISPDRPCLYSQRIIWWKLTSLWVFTLNKAKFFFNGYLHSLPIPIFSFKSLHTHAHTFAHIHTRTPGSPLGLTWRGPKNSGFWSQHPFLMQRTNPHLWLRFQTI